MKEHQQHENEMEKELLKPQKKVLKQLTERRIRQLRRLKK
jgi:hypothetical protein